MNVERVKKEMLARYPGVNIKENPDAEGKITEMVGEIDRQLVDSDRDVAVVVADASVEHLHKVITEEYEVLHGTLRVFRNGNATNVEVGERITIEPGTRHHVQGDETWFYCYSIPDWFAGDYYELSSGS